MVLNPGAIGVLSARILQPWRGVWMADLNLDPLDVALAPVAGKVTLTIGAPPGAVSTMIGTIDPRGSGQFAGTYKLRVVGGGGGWEQTVTRLAFHSDAQLLSPAVYVPTGALVGEVVSVLVPIPLGIDFVRAVGPAARVLDREPSWWVDPATGTTFVGPRPPAIPDPSLTLLYSDQLTDTVECTCDVLVTPGTPILDPRLGPEAIIVRDVEQTFDGKGSRVTAWCADAATSQLTNELRSMVVAFSGRRLLQSYLYRIVTQNPADGRLSLQAVDAAEGAPDLVAISPWTGVSGATVKYKLGMLVRMSFLEGDETQPIVDAYQPGIVPLEADYDAEVAVNVGASAAVVALAGGAAPLATGPWATALMTALAGFAAALPPGTPAAVTTAAGTLATALTSLASSALTKKVTAT
jgi:hypothetical protein